MSRWLTRVEHHRGDVVSTRPVIKDYDKDPTYCRSGIWWGIRKDSSVTVVYACPAGDPIDGFPDGLFAMAIDEHLLYPDIVDSKPVEPPAGTVRPVPTCPGLTYQVSRTGNDYRIAFTLAAGSDEIERTLYAVPVPCNEPDSATIRLSGYVTAWDPSFHEQERRCRAVIDAVRRRVDVFGRPGPPGPVERWFADLRGDEVRTVRELVNVFNDETVDADVRDHAMSRLAGSYLTANARLDRTFVEPEPEPEPDAVT